MKNETAKKYFLLIMMVLGWFALIGQLYLIIQNSHSPISETIIRYFCYFTILTNIMVAYCCTVLLANPKSIAGKFFSKQTNIAATTLYIFVVGLIYNLILRALWKPEGLQLIVNELLHSVIPVVFIIYWFIFAPKENLKWKNIWLWMIYPLAYCIIILLRGAKTGEYPYPFIDVTELGYHKALLNCGYIAIVFIVFAFLIVGIAKLVSKKKIIM
jgi:hypothetical protein